MPMRIAENTPARLVVEDSGSGFGLACVLAGHAAVGLAIAKPPFHLWLLLVEIAAGIGVAVYGAFSLTKTRTLIDRILGEIRYERRNFFRMQAEHAYFYQVEEVFLQRGPAETERFTADPAQGGSFRPALRVRGEAWPLARGFRDHRTAMNVARAVRAALDEFALGAAPDIQSFRSGFRT